LETGFFSLQGSGKCRLRGDREKAGEKGGGTDGRKKRRGECTRGEVLGVGRLVSWGGRVQQFWIGGGRLTLVTLQGERRQKEATTGKYRAKKKVGELAGSPA